MLVFNCKFVLYPVSVSKKFISLRPPGLISRNTRGCVTRSDKSEVYAKAAMDFIALAAQATGFVLWPLMDADAYYNMWVIPPTIFAISCGYWENYTSKYSIFGK